MKSKLLVIAVITMTAVMISPAYVLGQNSTPYKSTEKNKKAEKVKPPQTFDTSIPGSIPAGQKGKVEKNDQEKGYEKTGDLGKKEGWNKEKQDKEVKQSSVTENNKKKEKEIKKAEKKKKKEMRKAQREMRKKIRAAEKQKAKSEKEMKKIKSSVN